MQKNTLLIAVVLSTVTALTIPTTADANTSGSSAALITRFEAKQKTEDKRAKILKSFLESYDSPLAPYADVFIEEADKNGLDWKLVPAIAGVESYFGQQIPPYSYNAWGYGVYGNNVRRFASWEDGIGVVSQALRKDYMDKWGAENVAEIGAIYAADPRWTNKVQHFITALEDFESKKTKNSLSISL